MSIKRIVFLPYKLHLRQFLYALSDRMRVTVLLPPEKKLEDGVKISGIGIRYFQFGTDIIKRFIGMEVRTQKYVVGLNKILGKLDFEYLVVCEFYHWYTLQCIKYRRKRKNVKLYIISETKCWPRNRLAKIVKRLFLVYLKKNIRYVNKVFVYTLPARDFIKSYIPDARVELLPAPVDHKLFSMSKRTKTFCKNGTLSLLMNARYSTYKRHEDMFIVMRKLLAVGLRVHLTCISRVNKGRVRVENLARRIGVDKYVDFIDSLPQESMPDLYRSHDLLVLPSYNEAIGMVVPEGMLCGIPTITSDTVGANVYVRDKETGFIFKTGDIDDLYRVLLKCFDSNLLSRMGAEAHSHIKNNFTAQSVVDRFVKSSIKK